MINYMPEIAEFEKKALQAFGYGRPLLNKTDELESFQYIRIPVEISHDKLAFGSDPNIDIADPFVFFRNLGPSIIIIVGEYGFGKTELINQLCLFTNHRRSLMDNRFVLPVNLAQCRKKQHLLRNLSELNNHARSEQFAELIFSELTHDSRDFAKLRKEIQDGNLVLLLDGLDELISYKTPDIHWDFFKSIVNFLLSGTVQSKVASLVVLSMRLEYLRAFDDDNANRLMKVIKHEVGKNILPVHFVRLSPFSLEYIREYLCKNISRKNQDVVSLFSRIEKNRPLLEILKRPLLLNMWCQLGLNKSFLTNITEEAELFDEFISFSSDKMKREVGQDMSWNINGLSKKALAMYIDRREEISGLELLDIISAKNSSPNQSKALRAIHKCPFLDIMKPIDTFGKYPRVAIRFAHRSFFEYFTAKGMVLEIIKKRNDSYEQRFEHFNNLVLNYDMRKFLKSLFSQTGQDYYECAFFAWGLKDQVWNWGSKGRKARLDEWHKVLLDSMTRDKFTADEKKRLYDAINGLLEESKVGPTIHPSFLLYAYESISVHMLHNTGAIVVFKLIDKFSSELQNSAIHLIKSQVNTKNDSIYHQKYQLLLEKILDIADRLILDWVNGFVSSYKGNILELVDNPDVRGRLNNTIKHIMEA